MTARLYPISMKMARKIYERKWNIGVYRGTDFSIHTIKNDEEIVEKYGNRVFTPEGIVKVRAVVSDIAESSFLPATYGVKQAFVEGKMVADLHEVTTYESLYEGIAEVGEEILVRGKLEDVEDKRKHENYHRVLVGSLEGAGADYLRFV
jgi:predicted nucleotidyltransferase